MWRAIALCLSCTSFAFAQEHSNWTVEKLTGGLQYASAILWSRDGYLLIADLPAGKITRIDSKGSSIYREKTFAGGLALDSENRLYVCDPHDRRVTRIDKKGREEILAERWEGKRLNGPNGVAVSKNGHVWFTDPAFASVDQKKELSFYGVYHLPPKGELELAARLSGRPNGVAVAHDGRSLYVVDSDGRNVIAWTVDKKGALSDQRQFAHVVSGVPNGIAAGSDGKLYVAARDVEVFDSSGKPDVRIELVEKPADLVLAEADVPTLYVAARTSVYRVRFGAPASKDGSR